ncbi:MAG TPA: ATP-dependent RNA helicase DbpA [Bdellovibrionales bacterium]|nr:MAG: ATP-dependent RNA helicase DbpA [Bdellovibrionales bacterium GWB1_52_6]OFZ04851.1 MAG: ATP-dependent RNA helicase DbpA [Bdellovibrionales bacterium GWA1_52_35]OFZ43897.1 MAG: ATP-dependent RNA helicase DbpA [Bdellovibrionales bacterium GWC1_52_8]HAR43564.1 ATP-dependent RNA helicase DbpA [Bdellovibrionales bacterium]HCM38937.1 ATP-dependent RNA helicase DbpA [Bdellovibrionales bacterium]
MTKDFDSLHLSPSLTQVVQELGYAQLTPIQAKAIPLLMEGKDLIGQAKTGSGKTAAFTLPILHMLEQKRGLAGRKVQALVLCPTRELCTQVAREIRKLGRRQPGLQVLILSGGQPMHPQLSALEKGVHIVVGTPGRVLDHLKRETLDLRSIFSVVLDEADRMLDMGFQEDMEKILQKTPRKRQTLFFSATFPRSIAAMSAAYQRHPVRVTVEEEKQTTVAIKQVVYEVPFGAKPSALLWLLQQNQFESALVFCNLKTTVNEVVLILSKSGVSAGCLHGDLEQNARDKVLAKFRNHSTRVLIATDVAARGLDIESLDVVFNYDLPPQGEIYVHRIGRTGRAGKKGLAIALSTPREKSKIQIIEQFTGSKLEWKTVASPEQLEAETQKKNLHRDAKMATLYISGGRKDKMRPGDILGALTGEAGGLNASDIGKIEVHDRFSYVAVSKNLAEIAVQRLRNGRIKGRKFGIELVR